jgi:uncharacterized membrane protein YeaQ/YmgE (transglycosylase-associated protein family)
MPAAPELSQAAQQWANTVLVWVGFGTLVGLMAKAIMPGRDPGGAVATLMMGVGGSVIGCGCLSYFYHGDHISPISLIGFVVGTAGAFTLLFFYRLLGGRIFREGDTGIHNVVGPRYARGRRYTSTRIDD